MTILNILRLHISLATRLCDFATNRPDGMTASFTLRAHKRYPNLSAEHHAKFDKQLTFPLVTLRHPSLRAKKYGEAPDYLDAALPWMSLEILQSAVARAGLDKEKVRAIIAQDTFETINGKVRFEGVQNVITPTAFVQMQKGKLQMVWPKSIATGQYEPKKGW